MKKKDLLPFVHVVVDRRGLSFETWTHSSKLVMEDGKLASVHEVGDLSTYDEDLKELDRSYDMYDIMEVYKIKKHNSLFYLCGDSNLELVWKR